VRCLIVRGQPFWVFGHVALHPVLIHCGLSPRNTPARMGGLLFLPKSRAASRLESRFYRWRWEGGNTPATHPMGGTRGRASTRTATRQCTAARQTVIYVHRQLPTRGGSLHIAARSVMCTNTAPTQHRATHPTPLPPTATRRLTPSCPHSAGLRYPKAHLCTTAPSLQARGGSVANVPPTKATPIATPTHPCHLFSSRAMQAGGAWRH
jgi:hypothetical protein